MDQIRSFIAIELPEDLKRSLARFRDGLKKDTPSGVRWVDPEGIHLTLKFLGNVSTDRLGELAIAVERAVKGIPPFSLEAGGTGVFPNPGKTRIAWVGLGGDMAKLIWLQKRIEDECAAEGFERDTRVFSPHLTIARVNDHVPLLGRRAFGQQVISAHFHTVRFGITSVNLMKSDLERTGAVYTRMAFSRLG